MERCNLTNKQNTKKRNYRNESSCFRLVLFVCYSFFKEMQITKLTKYMVWNCITILSIIFQGSFENLVSCGFSIYPFSSDFYIVWNSILRGNTLNWEISWGYVTRHYAFCCWFLRLMSTREIGDGLLMTESICDSLMIISKLMIFVHIYI